MSERDEAALRAESDAVGPIPASSRRWRPAPDDLRLAYRRALLCTAARDLTAPEPADAVEGVVRELSALATPWWRPGLALARAEVPRWETVRLGVIALGKCGARELNYVSDVDVLYIAEPALGVAGEPVVSASEAVALASKIVASLSRTTSAHSAAGTIWPLDAALRPEGKAGPLVRTLASMRAYYERWAKDWEFQAMLKARPMAGDLHLAQDFVDMVWPLVWQVGGHDDFVPAVQAMRKRVISLIPAKEADAEIKLGAGGLRDTEFSVQLLQLVHGRSDEARSRGWPRWSSTGTSGARTEPAWTPPTGSSGCWSIGSSSPSCAARICSRPMPRPDAPWPGACGCLTATPWRRPTRRPSGGC